MNWLLIATIAQIILGSSAVFDKLLISRRSIDPIVYSFWLGVLGLFAFLLVPFGIGNVSVETVLWALSGGAFFIIAFFFLYWTLEKGEASAVFPFIGVVSPIFTFLFFIFLGGEGLGFAHAFGFLFFIFGATILFFLEQKNARTRILLGGCASAFFFAGSVVVSKIVFFQASFIAGFFWMKMGGVLVIFAALCMPEVRKRIFSAYKEISHHSKMLYFLNRAYAACGSVLAHFAVFLALNPALVDVTQNIKFVAIFVFAWLVGQERFSGRVLAGKFAAFAAITVGFFAFSAGEYIKNIPPAREDRPIAWGITFSQKFAEQIGLDWKIAYSAIISDLKPKKLRLVAYWDRIEKESGQFDFSELDFQLDGARDAGLEIVLAIGMKTPRWPECHVPAWALPLPTEEREIKLREYLKILIERYRTEAGIRVWQVENEPYLMFGLCPSRESEFLEKEIELVKHLDPLRPILVTDGGEFGLWYGAVRHGDGFGTTMYRKVYPKFIGRIFGTIEYPLGPEYFRLKEKLIRFFVGDFKKKFLVIELQAEPWGHTEINNLSYEEQTALFSPEYFIETVEYAKKTGFEEYYLWGAEWWYFLKNKKNDSRYWVTAKILLNNGFVDGKK